MAKTWFITGCSSGFGYEMCKLILENDGRLIATASKIEKIKQWEIDYPGRVVVMEMDVTDNLQVEAVVAKSLQIFPSIDIVINNAGYGIAGAIEEVSDGEARKIFDTNLFGLLNVTKALLPHLRKNKAGTIVNFSSIAGVRASAGLGIYAATKFAVEAVSEALSEEVKPLGIRVIIVEPGGFRTNWGGSAMAIAQNHIDDYNSSSGGTKNFFKSAEMPNVATGNPKKLAIEVINIALAKNPPLRLALGEDSYKGIKRKLETMEEELEKWKSVSSRTSF